MQNFSRKDFTLKVKVLCLNCSKGINILKELTITRHLKMENTKNYKIVSVIRGRKSGGFRRFGSQNCLPNNALAVPLHLGQVIDLLTSLLNTANLLGLRNAKIFSTQCKRFVRQKKLF
jgi:hypothetical protein